MPRAAYRCPVANCYSVAGPTGVGLENAVSAADGTCIDPHLPFGLSPVRPDNDHTESLGIRCGPSIETTRKVGSPTFADSVSGFSHMNNFLSTTWGISLGRHKSNSKARGRPQ